jgi:hypothetical protein
MRWADYVACNGETRYEYSTLVGNLTGREHLEDICVDEMIIL